MTHTAVASRPARQRASAWVHMPGLDGVRAIAVLAVVVFHMDESWLPGGFLGVDVFFTLSGFLITSLLLAERRASGRFATVAMVSVSPDRSRLEVLLCGHPAPPG